MITPVNIFSALRAGFQGDVHTFVNARLQPTPSMARVGGQLVGASGVVGFWRVKDEPKGVFIAEASASAWHAAQIQEKRTQRKHLGDNPKTRGKHLEDGKEAT